jgi:cytochrome c-type biogenesis protein CcmH/NrfF
VGRRGDSETRQIGDRFFKETCTMSTPLAELWGIEWLFWWQIPLLLVLIGLIWFLVWNKKRQM